MYNTAMQAYLRVAEERFRDVQNPLLTDLDIHNGQLFIDKSSRTVTMLDKGQASLIVPRERELALLLLRASTGQLTVESVLRDLNGFNDLLGIGIKMVTAVEFPSFFVQRFRL